MAYNPFHIFRRNQKAIFAVVTVIIMFVFVLSSGLGNGADFFDWLGRWIGNKSQKGDVIAKLDGSKIYGSDLERLQFRRVMANRFMVLAAQHTDFALMQAEEQQMQQITDLGTRRVLNEGARAAATLKQPIYQMLAGNPQFAPQLAQMRQLAQEYENLATSPTAKPAEKEIIRLRQYREMLEELLNFSMREQRGRGGEHYFFNAPNRTPTDRINFMLWQKKADQLGIRFSEEDTLQLIKREFFNYFTTVAPVRKEMDEQFKRMSFDECIDAIGEEFRVRAAQSAVVGPQMVFLLGDRRFGGSTVFAPPFELFQFYRDKTSPTDFEAFPVPVAAFMKDVAGPPPESELKRLYDEYKDYEPNPAFERPGFKTPPMVKLQWLSASGEEPYYQKMAEESLNTGELQAKVGSLLTIPLPGVGVPWVAAATAPALSKDLLLDLDSVRSEYARQVKDRHESALQSNWAFPSFVTRILDTSVVRPPTLVAALGGFAGGTMTMGGSLTGLGTFQTAVRAFELRDRIMAGTPAVLGTVPGPGMFPTMMGGYAQMVALLPRSLPIDVVRPELIRNLKEQTAKQLVTNDLKKFAAKVAELSENGAAKNKEPAMKYISEFIAARGLQHGASEKLHSEFTLENDPGLAPLKEVLTKSPHGSGVVQFGRKFFWVEDNGRGGPRTAASGTFKPEFYPNEPSGFESPSAKPEPRFMVWRTEETPAKQARDFQSVREQVITAWKRIKARDLANGKAEALAAQLQGMPGDTPSLIEQNMYELQNSFRSTITDPKLKERVRVFTIRGVSPLVGSEGFGGMGLMPFTLNPTNDIPFPTPEMAKTLIDERTKPPRTAFVLVDNPKDMYFVVALKHRDVKSVEEFQIRVYMDLAGGRQGGVLSAYTADAQRKAWESAIAILKQEFRFEATDDQKKKLEEGDKRGMDQ